jgi:hypothetical protein
MIRGYWANLLILGLLALGLCRRGVSQAQPARVVTVSVCQLASRPTEFLDSRVTLKARVNIYRHGTAISDAACPKQELTLVPDKADNQPDSVLQFYRFLAEHRQSRIPISAIITGRLARGEEGGFLPKRQVVFRLESVSEIGEDRHQKVP